MAIESNNMSENDNWIANSQHVLRSLDRISDEIREFRDAFQKKIDDINDKIDGYKDNIDEDYDKIKEDVLTLKIKSGLYGAGSGGGVVLIQYLWEWIKTRT